MDFRVGVYHGRLGVENQSVEIENQGAQGLQAVQNGIAEGGRQRDSGSMNRSHVVAIIALATVSCAFADPDQFSQVVKPADFAAAGLSKLSPGELARLDQLVEAYKSGALEAARQQAAAATAAQAAAEARAAQAEAAAKTAQAAATKAKDDAAAQAAAEKKASGGSLLSRAMVMITPGTKVVYQSVESRIIGGVSGWNAHTIFTLENGQEWQVSDYSHYFNGPPIDNPKVKLVPAGVLGGFRMEIEGIGEMRVRLISEPKVPASAPADTK
jgi:nucleoid-associated protein YgaU